MGAQLTSLALGGKEYLWQADPAVWGKHAPILFPIVGSIRDGKAESAQGEVTLGRHGLARDYEHAVVAQSEGSVTFELTDSEETRSAYPYAFKLNMTYELTGPASLTQTFRVENTGDVDLPFSVGGHPAFNCPLESGEKFEDYTVEFSGAVNQKCLRPDVETGLVDISKRYDVLDAPNKINLDHSLFDLDAMVFDNIKPKSAVLSAGGRGVKIDYQDFDNLLVWSSSNGGNFVALEPWTGISTCSDEDSVFENKRGMTVLEPDCEASFAFKITLI